MHPGPGALRSAPQEAAIPAIATNASDLAWRTAYRIGFPLARAWWAIRRPEHEGALVAVRVGPAVLVVRSSYRRAWNLPGGGVRPGETPAEAARRELAEEIGLQAPALTPAGRADGPWDNRQDRVHLFELHLEELPPLRLDNREITAARLATAAELRTMPLTGPLALYAQGLCPLGPLRGPSPLGP